MFCAPNPLLRLQNNCHFSSLSARKMQNSTKTTLGPCDLVFVQLAPVFLPRGGHFGIRCILLSVWFELVTFSLAKCQATFAFKSLPSCGALSLREIFCLSGKPGHCAPVVLRWSAYCPSNCNQDTQCYGSKKCCPTVCGGFECKIPVAGKKRPGKSAGRWL